MAKSSQPQSATGNATADDVSLSRAWELFARHVNVTGSATITHEKLAENCWLAAEAFETFLNSKPKG